MTKIDLSAVIIAEDKNARSESVAGERCRRAAQAYLDRTDWLVIRHAETGMPVPEDILERRAAARQELAP